MSERCQGTRQPASSETQPDSHCSYRTHRKREHQRVGEAVVPALSKDANPVQQIIRVWKSAENGTYRQSLQQSRLFRRPGGGG